MEEESWLVLLRRCWVGRNGQPGNELHGSNDCLGKSATSTRIGVDERLGGPCGSQSLPLGQVQRGVMPVMGGGQEARTLTRGSVLQAAERVGLSLLGIAGVVTDKWTCGGGGSNVKSNLLQLFDGATSTGYIYNFGKGGGSKCTLLSMSQGLMWWEEDQRWNKLPLEADCLVVVVCRVACRRHRGEEVAL